MLINSKSGAACGPGADEVLLTTPSGMRRSAAGTCISWEIASRHKSSSMSPFAQ